MEDAPEMDELPNNSERQVFRCSVEEKKLYKREATLHRMKVSDWIRRVLRAELDKKEEGS